MKVLVVGAGPGGLSAALSMSQNGISVQIAEIKPDRTALGSELWLNSAFLRALDTLGVADACVAMGSILDGASTVRKADGEIIAEIRPPKLTRPELPLSLGIGRRALHDVLYDACVKHGVAINHGVKLTDLKDDGLGVTAEFDDGHTETFDLVIGADGVNSTVRSIAFPDAAQPEFVGQYVWRARVPYSEEARLELYAGSYTNAGFISVTNDTAYIFCLVKVAEEHWIDESDYIPEIQKALSQFGGSIGANAAKITDPNGVNYAPLRPVLVTPTWFRNNVLLIGDAAHACTPHLAYGAGLAVEDGIVIGEELARHGNVQHAADAFMKRRFDRCAFVVDTATRLSKLQQTLPHPTPEQAQTLQEGQRRLAEPM